MRLVFIYLGWLCSVAGVAAITFNGAATNQVIDGFGVNVNCRSWNGAELQPVLDAFVDDAGMTLYRVVKELSDWEAVNDDADPNVINWTYFNPVYSSTEFTRCWDTMAYLNARGITNGAVLCFMGWGPGWMMDTNGRTLKAENEEEWAETIVSALVYARNTRGLKFRLVAPNNESDIYNEGIRMSGEQYTNALHRLALKLDTNGLSDLRFVGPDLASTDTGLMGSMLADPVIMAKLGHFGLHSYSGGGGGSSGIYGLIHNSAYPDRTFWMTEFNVWCPGCDTGTTGNYGWSYTRGTAEYLLSHLLNGASAGMVWEGYDSIYAHHGMVWSFWGLIGVDNTNAPVKTYTPRKHFYTVAQISKWVRPGAVRIGISGSTSPFSPLAAFKHDLIGQVSIVGVNTNSGSATLNGTLTNNMPQVSALDLYYTTATTNLAYGGQVTVSNGNFTMTIPGDCVFTLTGFTVRELTNGIPRTGSAVGTGKVQDCYHFTITNPVARAQFEVTAPTSDVTLLVRRDMPPEGFGAFDYQCDNPGTNSEMIVLRPGSGPRTLTAGSWFLGVLNTSGTNATYSVKATQWDVSGLPLLVQSAIIDSNSFCLTWNSLPQAAYVVKGIAGVLSGPWQDVSDTIVATNASTTFCLPLPSASNYFRVMEGVAVKMSGASP